MGRFGFGSLVLGIFDGVVSQQSIDGLKKFNCLRFCKCTQCKKKYTHFIRYKFRLLFDIINGKISQSAEIYLMMGEDLFLMEAIIIELM